MMALQWEEIEGERGVNRVERTKVPGGWLVRWHYDDYQFPWAGMTFVPDPDHEWDGNSLP